MTTTRGKKYPAEFLRADEISAILEACGPENNPYAMRHRALIVLMWRSGLRLAEALALRPADIDQSSQSVRVLHGKGDKARTTATDEQALEVINLWLSERTRQWGITDRHLPIISTKSGETMKQSYVRRKLPEIARAAGVERRVHAHVFRHAQPVNEVVMTPYGERPIGGLSVGDLVLGADGKPVRVTGVFPQGKQECYELTFTDGTSARSSSDHLWPMIKPAPARGNRKDLTPIVLPLSEVMQDTNNGSGSPVWMSPLPGDSKFEGKEVPLDPWLLGALLGDGYLGNNGTPLLTSGSDELWPLLSGCPLPEGTTITRRTNGWGFTLNNRPGSRYTRSPLADVITGLGLSGSRAASKFVPEIYKNNSSEVRLAVLQGLMDTDGHASSKGYASFVSKSEVLASDVAWLARSLGGRATHRSKKQDGKIFWTCSVTLPLGSNPFRLERKAARVRLRSLRRGAQARGLVSVEQVPDEEMVCIQVESEDGLYLTKDFIVTHNTFAVELSRAGVPVKDISVLLGHTNLATTSIYLSSLSPEESLAHLRKRKW